MPRRYAIPTTSRPHSVFPSSGWINIFTWNAADQVDGWDVAGQLNQRYGNFSNSCAGQASYYCDGVIVRVTAATSAYHAWDPSPQSESTGGVSFTYLRGDLGLTHLAWADSTPQGFIIKNKQAIIDSGEYPLSLNCSFAYDGGTVLRPNGGCGASTMFPTDSGPCDTLGIDTVAKWWVHFNSVPVSDNRYYHQCGFKPDQVNFALSLEAREHPEAESSAHRHTEVIIGTWPKNAAAQLPIEAFFYIYDQSRVADPGGAKFIQQDYYKTVGKVIPVISVALASGGQNIFSYHPSDQGL